ncbi:phenylacetate--CoA ligase family protein [Sutcliffiella rhizosphaerae]|uniref:Phenylacetate-coenzyme A ligase n=1 Tax=Sutcliffiella rhizosphaerae TaxID=2880967 RepID=A0ABN8ACI5_9BACI|nr:phenylacetate--CoA ligase [Sutcliffiella rhizosphaerae]CAG9621941.1 Phenylacetate-coenzyme A ligase [Sutcliffiella rhizosphaerae]
MTLHEVESISAESMRLLQLKRLQQTVKHIYKNVPFYQQKLFEQNLTPSDIHSIEDIQKLPFTTKNDLREHYPFGLFAIPPKQIARLHASSGTSGKPTVVAYSQKDIDMWADIVARAIYMAGGRSGDILHNSYGYGLFTGGLGLHYGSERLGMITVPVSGGNTERQIQLILDFKPSIICGTPSYILNIAEKMEEMDINPKSTSLQYGIFGAEPWSEEMRNTLETTFNIKACDIYGLSEVIGPGVAMECHEAQNGLHVAEDHFYVEVIDPKTGKVLSEGQKGELVFTSLTKEAMPIIRYRTGDIASIQKELCKCGRTTTKMSRVMGRVDDMMIIRGVNVFPSQIEHALLQIDGVTPHYQILLTKDNNFDMLEVQVETNYPVEEWKKLEKNITQSLRSACYVKVRVTVLPEKSIPRSHGKATRVIDKRRINV